MFIAEIIAIIDSLRNHAQLVSRNENQYTELLKTAASTKTTLEKNASYAVLTLQQCKDLFVEINTFVTKYYGEKKGCIAHCWKITLRTTFAKKIEEQFSAYNTALKKINEDFGTEVLVGIITILDAKPKALDTQNIRDGLKDRYRTLNSELHWIPPCAIPVPTDPSFPAPPPIRLSLKTLAEMGDRIFLQGPIGSGKTEASLSFMREWATTDATSMSGPSDNWVIHLPLPEILRHMDQNKIASFSLEDLLYTQILQPMNRNSSEARPFLEHLQQNSALFIFDGLDEIEPRAQEQFLNVVLNNVKHFLVTARSYTNLPIINSRVFCLTGISDQAIECHINTFFDSLQEGGSSLKTWLMQHPEYKELCHLPRFLSLTCSLWKKAYSYDPGFSPISLADLYKRATAAVMRDAFFKDEQVTNTQCTLLEPACTVLAFLKTLAFTYLEKGGEIDQSALSNLIDGDQAFRSRQTLYAEIMQAGLLESRDEITYSFLPGFQDYFAAGYIAEHIEEAEVQTFLGQHKFDPLQETFWPLVAAQLDPENLPLFFDLLRAPLQDLKGDYMRALLLRTLEVCQWPENLEITPMVLDSTRSYIQKLLNQVDCASAQYWIETLSLCPKVCHKLGVSALIRDHINLVQKSELPLSGLIQYWHFSTEESEYLLQTERVPSLERPHNRSADMNTTPMKHYTANYPTSAFVSRVRSMLPNTPLSPPNTEIKRYTNEEDTLITRGLILRKIQPSSSLTLSLSLQDLAWLRPNKEDSKTLAIEKLKTCFTLPLSEVTHIDIFSEALRSDSGDLQKTALRYLELWAGEDESRMRAACRMVADWLDQKWPVKPMSNDPQHSMEDDTVRLIDVLREGLSAPSRETLILLKKIASSGTDLFSYCHQDLSQNFEGLPTYIQHEFILLFSSIEDEQFLFKSIFNDLDSQEEDVLRSAISAFSKESLTAAQQNTVIEKLCALLQRDPQVALEIIMSIESFFIKNVPPDSVLSYALGRFVSPDCSFNEKKILTELFTEPHAFAYFLNQYPSQDLNQDPKRRAALIQHFFRKNPKTAVWLDGESVCWHDASNVLRQFPCANIALFQADLQEDLNQPAQDPETPDFTEIPETPKLKSFSTFIDNNSEAGTDTENSVSFDTVSFTPRTSSAEEQSTEATNSLPLASEPNNAAVTGIPSLVREDPPQPSFFEKFFCCFFFCRPKIEKTLIAAKDSLISVLNQYIANRTLGANKYTYFGKYDKTTKIDTANKLISLLRGEAINGGFSDLEQGAFNQGNLQGQLKQWFKDNCIVFAESREIHTFEAFFDYLMNSPPIAREPTNTFGAQE